MPQFNVTLERTYKARHVASILVEADDADAAEMIAAAALEENGEYDPETYKDSQASEGYDDCGSWGVAEGEAEPVDAEAPWAGADGKCRVCGGSHYQTRPCSGALVEPLKVEALPNFPRAKLAGYDVEPDGFGGWQAYDPDGVEIEQKATERSWPTEAAAWEACDRARMFGSADQ